MISAELLADYAQDINTAPLNPEPFAPQAYLKINMADGRYFEVGPDQTYTRITSVSDERVMLQGQIKRYKSSPGTAYAVLDTRAIDSVELYVFTKEE